MKKLFLFFLISCPFYNAFSQSKIELGFQISPTLSNIRTRVSNSEINPIYTQAFGPKLNWTKDRFQLSTGVLHMEQGAKFNVMETSITQPDGTGNIAIAKLTHKQILAPFLMRYLYVKRPKIQLTVGGGLYLGFTYLSETVVTGSATGSNFTQRENVIYAGVNVGTGIQYQWKPKVALEFRPNFLYQIKDVNPNNPTFINTMIAYGIDLGFHYTLAFNSGQPHMNY